METRIGLFRALVTVEQLRASGRGWVMAQDAILEIELLGDWVVSDRGPKLTRDLSCERDVVEPGQCQEVLVLCAEGPVCLRQVPDASPASIRLTDRYVALQKNPSEHADGRPDIRFGRG